MEQNRKFLLNNLKNRFCNVMVTDDILKELAWEDASSSVSIDEKHLLKFRKVLIILFVNNGNMRQWEKIQQFARVKKIDKNRRGRISLQSSWRLFREHRGEEHFSTNDISFNSSFFPRCRTHTTVAFSNNVH